MNTLSANTSSKTTAKVTKITKLLIANRGEIALRIMRTAREMGIKTVAVYSEADRHALHARYADEAVWVGEAASSASYLRTDRIIQAAKDTGAQAIHPGYGFLSENADFAREVEAAGLIFVGPPPQAIEVMGSKLAAKEAVGKYNVPLVPGSKGAVSSVAQAQKFAEEVGFPVLIKASAGGGGKGMRLVHKAEDMQEQMQMAQREAASSFGNDAVFIEKYVLNPRHIEIQVLADKHGNAIHLFERECSIQRRHQKVIEEAPSALLTEEVRQKMGEAALNVARACNYTNAGTVEFVADAEGNFYFLEMNTRLQVEHPVTEQITGLDLVAWQLRIAAGEPLTIKQEDLRIKNHSIEVRVYAEDPANNFLPDSGTLTTYLPPRGPGIRVDDGVEEGGEIAIHYDPMIAKLIATAPDRQSAINRMLRAIDEYQITGLETTLPFCRFVLSHEAFRSGNFDTSFVDKYFTPESLQSQPDEDTQLAAALAAFAFYEGKNTSRHKSQGSTGELGNSKHQEGQQWLENRR